MSKHADLASRIFRTVVFSGAMLGSAAPALAEQAAPPKESKAPAQKPDTWDSVNKEIEATDKKIDGAVVKLAAAYKAAAAKKTTGDYAAPDAALATAVADLRTARTGLTDRLAKTTRPPFANEKAAPDVETTEKALADADTKLFASVDTLVAAKEVADVKTATTGVETARKERVAAAAKVKAARTKANKRPRAPVEERPTGRGFILS